MKKKHQQECLCIDNLVLAKIRLLWLRPKRSVSLHVLYPWACSGLVTVPFLYLGQWRPIQYFYLFIFITINPIHLYQLKVRIDRNETRIDRNEPRIDKINKNMICHTNLNNEIVKIIIDPHKHKHMTIINY